MKKVLLTFLIALFTQVSTAQAIGEWRAHLPLHKGKSICKAGSKIYVSAYPSVFVYDQSDQSITELSKVNELSDLGATIIRYSEEYNTVIIGYESGNIDLIVNNQVINIPDIERSFLQASKSINDIKIEGEFAFLSTGFGIVVLDIQRKEIKETYNIGDNGSYVDVQELDFLNDTIWAATKEGLFYAKKTGVNLSDFQSWTQSTQFDPNVDMIAIVSTGSELVMAGTIYENDKDTIYQYKNGVWNKPTIPNYNGNNVTCLEYLNGEVLMGFVYNGLIVSSDLSSSKSIWTYGNDYGTPRPNDYAFDFENGWYLIADESNALVVRKGTWNHEVTKPEGPLSENCWDLEYAAGSMWVASGYVKYNLNNFWNKKGVYQFNNNSWTNHYDNGVDSIYDITVVAGDPNDPNHAFFGSWGQGLGELKDGNLNFYNANNSLVSSIPAFNWQAIGGVTFDKNGVLWVVNSPKSGNPIEAPLLAYDGATWREFKMGNVGSTGYYMNKIFIDENGYKWICTRYNGIIVFDDNGTLDDESDDRVYNLKEGSSLADLPSNEVHSLVHDADGKVWLGTEKGLSVIHSTAGVFDGDVKAERVIIEQDGSFQYLLETEAIRSIIKDGGNRKWVCTFSGGVYLLSEDGQETIHHFTTENSPLLSNNVIDAEIDGKTGEVFFATEKGIVSYIGDATDSETYDGPVYAYPNPVPSGYTGIIGIKGLVGNSEVKITDITGNIVYETMAEGGMATWDGFSMNGEKVHTGVYVVFSSNDDGSETQVAKILFIQ